LFALGIAGLAFSHLPSTLIVGHLIAAVIVWSLSQQDNWTARFEMAARFAVWGGLGIALSAIYWLPALGLLGTVSPDMLATDYYDATRWLLLDGQSEITPETTDFVKACLAVIVAVSLISIFILKQDKAPNGLWLWIIGPSLFAFFLMTVFSYPIWKFWILNKIQFPWRTLIVGELSLALGSIVIARHAVQNWTGSKRLRAQLFAGISALLLSMAYLVQVPRTVQTIEDSAARAGTFVPVGTPEYVPPRMLELALTRFRAVANDSHTSEERFYLFFDEMQRSAETAQAAFEEDAPGAVLTAEPHNRLSLQVTLNEPSEIRLPLAAWPFWRAETSDGRIVELGMDDALGLATLSLPAGTTQADIYIATTPPERLARLISTLALTLLIGGFALGQLRRNSSSEKPLATSVS